MRLGLFGGTFDPIHLGHLMVAQAALEELALTRVILIPAAQSPFKPGQVPTAPGHRLAMLRLALAGQNRIGLDDSEVQRGGVSYTVDTLRAVAGQNPGAELFWLIGSDHVPLLPGWREAGELARMATFVAVPRPGHALSPAPEGFRVVWLKGFPLEVSSSILRERVRIGLSIQHLVPPAVAEWIEKNRLYL